MRLFRSHEGLISIVLVVLSVVIGIINPAVFSLSHLFDLLKSSAVMGIFAIGVLIVLVSGGIDISFTAIAAFSMYVTSRILTGSVLGESMVIPFVMSGLIGAGLGFFNALFISLLHLPTLIVTLGTAALFRGLLLAFIGTTIVNSLPQGMVSFSKLALLQRTLEQGQTAGLSLSVVIFAGIALCAWWGLRYTMPGRGIYAMGGNTEVAQRSGFNVTRLRFLIYGLVGALSGIAGIIHAATLRNANPFDLVGTELTVIAAVVLGGAHITGGRGTVIGTVLGVLLIVVMNNSLILLGIPSHYQRVVTGLIIITSTAVTSQRGFR